MATCGEVLVRLLEAHGVDTVFGIPGVHTVELYRGLPDTEIRHITPRHEQGAGFMADGYARVTGKPGVCFIITGPGITNISTAMAQAFSDSIPMLVISSVNRRAELGLGEGRLHELPSQKQLVEACSVFSHTLLSPHDLRKVMARAFAVFASERPGPVHIEIPLDVITAELEDSEVTPLTLPSRPGPCSGAIAKAAAILAGAQRPLIVLGGGSIDAGAEISRLAERLDAPVVNTVNAKGVVPASHPLSVSASPTLEGVRAAMADADAILAIGTEFAETEFDFFFKGAELQFGGPVVRVDIEAQQLTRNMSPDVAIVSDARLAASALLSALGDGAGDTLEGGARAAAIREACAQDFDPRFQPFLDALSDALPGVIVAGDSTQPTYFATLQYDCERPRTYFHSASGFGTLGYGLPAAFGAKLGAPGRPVVSLIGDGGAMFTLTELAAGVEAQLPVAIIIWNNHGYQEIKRFMVERDLPTIGVDIYTPDFVTIAKGMGCVGIRATTIDDLKTALVDSQSRTVPTVIEVLEDDMLGSET